jgi:hypothetical protein
MDLSLSLAASWPQGQESLPSRRAAPSASTNSSRSAMTRKSPHGTHRAGGTHCRDRPRHRHPVRLRATRRPLSECASAGEPHAEGGAGHAPQYQPLSVGDRGTGLQRRRTAHGRSGGHWRPRPDDRPPRRWSTRGGGNDGLVWEVCRAARTRSGVGPPDRRPAEPRDRPHAPRADGVGGDICSRHPVAPAGDVCRDPRSRPAEGSLPRRPPLRARDQSGEADASSDEGGRQDRSPREAAAAAAASTRSSDGSAG